MLRGNARYQVRDLPEQHLVETAGADLPAHELFAARIQVAAHWQFADSSQFSRAFKKR